MWLLCLTLSCVLLQSQSRQLEDLARKARGTSWRKDRLEMMRSCLSKITAYNTEKNRDLVILFREQITDPDIDTALATIAYPIVIIGEDLEGRRYRHVRNNEIGYIFSTRAVATVLNSVSWDTSTKFIVVCPSLADARVVFQEFWEERVTDVIALVYDEKVKRVDVFTFFPYTKLHCARAHHASLLTSWNGTFVRAGVNLFPHKMSDLHGCPLTVTLLLRPPSVILAEGAQDVSGIEIEILKATAQALNALPVFTLLHNILKYRQRRTGNTLMQELVENMSDVVAGSLMYTRSVSPVSEGIQYGGSLCVAMALPKSTAKPYLWVFVSGISEGFFYGILISTVLCIVSLHLIARFTEKTATLWKTAWLTVSPLIGGSPTPPTHFTAKALFVLWLWACFLFCKVIEGSVSSSVMVQTPDKQLETIEDVLNSDLYIQGETFLMFEVLPKYLYSGYKAKITNTSVITVEGLRNIVQGKNIGFLGTVENIKYYWSPEAERQVYLQSSCITTYSPVIQVRKNSPFYADLTRRIRALTEFGVIRKYVKFFKQDGAEREKTSLGQGEKALSRANLIGAFHLWIMGMSLGLLVFLMELSYVRCARTVALLRNH